MHGFDEVDVATGKMGTWKLLPPLSHERIIGTQQVVEFKGGMGDRAHDGTGAQSLGRDCGRGRVLGCPGGLLTSHSL